MEAKRRTLRVYATVSGAKPFDEWLGALSDRMTRARVAARLERVEAGNFGDHHAVGEGVMEIRMDLGAGIRVYYALDGKTVVLLLTGGDKGSQDRDIRRAKEYWSDYKARGRKRHG